MSKRHSQSIISHGTATKLSKSSSWQNEENNQYGNQAASQDSGYYSESQGKDDQVMDFAESSNQADQWTIPEQGIQAGVSWSDKFKTEESLPDDLLHVMVDEDSNQMPLSDIIRITGKANRPFAENVLHCKVAIGPDAASHQKKEKKRRRKKGFDEKDEESPQECVLRLICALLNSGGGVLAMKIEDFQGPSRKEKTPAKNALDDFWKKIEPKLKAMISPSTYDDVFDRCGESDEILLFVTAPQHFCTMEFNLFLPGDASVEEATYEQTVKLLKKETKGKRRNQSSGVVVSLKDLPAIPETFTYKEILPFHENKQIQLKDFRSETILDSNNRTQRHSISRQMSAFCNARGGVILLGVTDGGEVNGIDVERNSKEEIEERVISIVKKMCCDFELQRKVHWDMEFVPVLRCKSSAVLVIYVAGMGGSGGVFARCPKSFQLIQGEDEEIVKLLEFVEWKKRMLLGMDLQGNSKGMEGVISRFQELRVSKGHLLTVKGDVQRVKDAFFVVKEGFPVTPEGFERNLPEEAQAIIKQIQKQCSRDRNRGILVASHSWRRNMGGSSMDGLICDLLLVSRNMGGLHLFTLCHSSDREEFLEFLEYGREAARSIKRSLVKDGACSEKFYISYHVVSCNTTELALRDERYPQGYDLQSPRGKLNEVLKALVIILATIPSTLSNKLGVGIMNLLTREQFQLVYQQIEVNKELWIKGAAGTGKTLVAVEFMRELQRRQKLDKEEILCVCENAGIRNQIKGSNVCETVCRQTFLLRTQFPRVKHVVMDEVHNYEVPKDSVPEDLLYQQARRLVRQHNPKQPGYLWFFTDKCQTNHTFPMGMPDETQQKPCFRLKKVIRNSRKIFNHAKQYLTADNVGDILEMGHDFDGESVELISYSQEGKTQLGVLKETIQDLFRNGYSPRDIAVLFKDIYSIPKELSNRLNTSTCTAEENSSDCLVASTVLKYSGLERPVVVLVDVEDSIPWGRKRDPFIYCAVTRAMVKLLIIRRRK